MSGDHSNWPFPRRERLSVPNAELLAIRKPTDSQTVAFHAAGVEMLRLDPTGMTYQGKLIEDAGEAHRAFLAVMQQMGSATEREACAQIAEQSESAAHAAQRIRDRGRA